MRRINTVLYVWIIFLFCMQFNAPVFAQSNSVLEIHSKHFFYGQPTGTPETNDLIIRDIYALSSNDETKKEHFNN